MGKLIRELNKNSIKMLKIVKCSNVSFHWCHFGIILFFIRKEVQKSNQMLITLSLCQLISRRFPLLSLILLERAKFWKNNAGQLVISIKISNKGNASHCVYLFSQMEIRAENNEFLRLHKLRCSTFQDPGYEPSICPSKNAYYILGQKTFRRGYTHVFPFSAWGCRTILIV